MNLYSTYAKDFSDSRQSPWKGWEVLFKSEDLRFKIENEGLEILDLGCGNGRFLKFLINKNIKINNYLGVDSSKELLTIAKEEFKDFRLLTSDFKQIDLENPDWQKEINGKYNLITAFGLMHHLQTFDSRRNILEYSSKLLRNDGLLVVTYWQFAKLDRYKNKMKRLESDPNDYIMTFGDNGAERFCHFCDEQEISKLEEGLNLERIDSYYSDGKENDQNLYIIYKK